MGSTKVLTEATGTIRRMLSETGRVPGEVLAAGQLRQGRAPSMIQMVTGAALIEIWRPRRSKLMPRHFIVAATADQIYVFKCSGGSDDNHGPYEARVSDEVYATFRRSEMRLTDLPEGAKSKGATMELQGESFPVSRPNLSGDPNTDELIELLAS